MPMQNQLKKSVSRSKSQGIFLTAFTVFSAVFYNFRLEAQAFSYREPDYYCYMRVRSGRVINLAKFCQPSPPASSQTGSTQ